MIHLICDKNDLNEFNTDEVSEVSYSEMNLKMNLDCNCYRNLCKIKAFNTVHMCFVIIYQIQPTYMKQLDVFEMCSKIFNFPPVLAQFWPAHSNSICTRSEGVNRATDIYLLLKECILCITQLLLIKMLRTIYLLLAT